MRDKRIESLDGLRGLAASAVVYAHIGFFYPSDNPWIHLDTGDPAVAIFFSLSGFLMAALYAHRPFDPWDYLIHRMSRIYPVYLVAVLAVFAITLLTHGSYIQPLAGTVQLARHVAMLGSTGVFWSIPAEVQFYLFFLLLWLAYLNPQKFHWVFVATGAYLAVAAYFGFPGPGFLLTSKLPYFLFGAFAGYLFRRSEYRFDSPATGFATLALLAFFYLAPGLFPRTGTFWGMTTALTAALIVYLAACDQKVSALLLTHPLLRFFGKISFSLYLFHMPVIFLTIGFLRTFLPLEVALALSVLAAYCFAAISFYAIEDPARIFLTRNLKARLRRIPVAAE